MKIKRFEASSMSDALRQIKKEFGDEAVILSAKSQKKSKRFLGKNGVSQVVVTAAIDKTSESAPPATSPVSEHGVKGLGNDPKVGAGGAYYSGSSILKRFTPITKTGRKILKPKIVRLMNEPAPETSPTSVYRRLIGSGMNEALAVEWDQQIQDQLPGGDTKSADIVQALSQAIQAKEMVGSTYHAPAEQQKCTVVVGPPGAGKTSFAAKMAAKLALKHPDSVAIISLDNQRVAGTTELERFAPIIGVPFKAAFTVEELSEVLYQWRALSHIVVDTPAVSLDDPLQLEKLRKMLDLLDSAEKLLLISAAIQEKAMARMIQYFKPLHIHSLVFTGLDWCVDFGSMVNQCQEQTLPMGFVSDSPKISGGVKAVTAKSLAAILLGETGSHASAETDSASVALPSRHTADRYYVANRNSDIFHFHNCKSVKRINTKNMIVFKDSTEALGQQFKPCRMCCSELIVPQPLERPARGYAGYRY